MVHLLRRLVRRSKTTGAVVVKRRLSPPVKLLIFGVVAIVIIAGAVFLYDHGVSMAGFERSLATSQQQRLEEEGRQLGDDNVQLREALARAERTIQMDQAAYQELDKALQSSAQEIVKLREELNFYRNIISPADRKGGLRVQSLNVEQAGTANSYRYKLVVIQALKHDRNVFGTAYLEIVGMQGGENTTLRIPGQGERPIQLNLKYFQDIEGKFDLPRGFRAQSIKVNVIPAGGSQAIQALYDWPHA